MLRRFLVSWLLAWSEASGVHSPEIEWETRWREAVLAEACPLSGGPARSCPLFSLCSCLTSTEWSVRS